MRVIALLVYLLDGQPHAEALFVESYEKCLKARPQVVELFEQDKNAKLIRFECIREEI